MYESGDDTMIEFFMPMEPPTCTHQEKQVHVVNGKPVFYEPVELKAARAKLRAHMSRHVPEEPAQGALRLTTWWCFPLRTGHHDGEYKTSKPDTDNLVKLLTDVMTDMGVWRDDAHVASEVICKYWAAHPGIDIRLESL